MCLPSFRIRRSIRPDEASKWVIVRNGHDPIVVNLESIDETQQAATSLTHPGALGRNLP